MRVTLREAIVGMSIAACVVAGTGPAGAATPIGPRQHFVGLVNDTRQNADVKVVCAGPVSGGRTGPVAGGQTMAVAQVAKGHGFTGLFSQVYAWFVPAKSTDRPTQLKFARYGVRKGIPTSIRVPCDGTGMVEFSSCPYLAPCAAGWVPTYVSVRFVNIAV
jgi:hypothetical protein